MGILASKRVPKTGVYLENCKYVSYGYFGNLEIFSLAAFETLVANVDSCKASLPWQIGVKNGIYGPMGEDLFAQQCLDSVGVLPPGRPSGRRASTRAPTVPRARRRTK